MAPIVQFPLVLIPLRPVFLSTLFLEHLSICSLFEVGDEVYTHIKQQARL